MRGRQLNGRNDVISGVFVDYNYIDLSIYKHRDNSTEGETSAEEQLRKLKEKFDRAIEKSERQLQAQLDSYKRSILV